MQPAGARDEEHRDQRGAVGERRPEVGLPLDEQDRDEREPDGREQRRELGHAPAAVGEEAGEEEREQHLPELRRLQLEEAEVDPSPRAAHDRAGDEHEAHQRERADVERLLVAAVHVGIDRERDEEEHEAADGVGDLARHLAAGRVRRRDPVDRPQAVAEQRGERGHQHPVEPAQPVAERGCVLRARRPQPARPRVDGLDVDHRHPVTGI